MNGIWKDYHGEEFDFEGRLATIIHPSCTPNGKMVLKTEYLDAFPTFEKAMLDRGYYVINVKHANRWGTADTIEQTARFVKEMAKRLGTDEKCVMVGMSCGGLQSLLLARKYPELCAVMFLDAPVMNLLSLAGLGVAENAEGMWNEISQAYGMDKSALVTFRESPIDYLDELFALNIPIFMEYGDADTVVPYGENGKVLEDYYKAHGGIMTVLPCPGRGHHPHGLTDPAPIVEFVERYI